MCAIKLTTINNMISFHILNTYIIVLFITLDIFNKHNYRWPLAS